MLKKEAYIKWFYATKGSEDEITFIKGYHHNIRDPLTLDQPEKGDADSELYRAVFQQNVKKVDRLLEDGHSPDQCFVGPYGVHNYTLHRAVQNKSTELVHLLYRKNCDLEVEDGKGRTALMIAVEQEDMQMIKLLIGKSANGNTRDEFGNSVLERALLDISEMEALPYDPVLTRQRLDMIKVILKSDPQPDCHVFKWLCTYIDDGVQTPRRTALHVACSARLWSVAALLANTGICDVHRVDEKQRTPFHIAIEYHNPHCPSWLDAVEALVYAGSDIDKPNEQMGYPLVHVIRRACPPLVRLMILANADIHSSRLDCMPDVRIKDKETVRYIYGQRVGPPLQHAIFACHDFLVHEHSQTHIGKYDWIMAWSYFGIIWMLLCAGANVRCLDFEYQGFVANIRKSLWGGTRRPPGLRNCKRVIIDIERRMKRPDRLDEICRNTIRLLMGKRLQSNITKLPMSKTSREFVLLDNLPVFRTEIPLDDFKYDCDTESDGDITDEGE